MKVLMLGWEFPPHISGGLGTACYGLTQGLAKHGVDVSSASTASAAIATMETDIETIASNRATFGAVQNRFEAVIANLSVSVENMSAARSRVQDADFAAETAKLTRAQILQQAGVAMLSQANIAPQAALALLS